MSTDDSYDQVRRDFEELGVEKRARFLIEASASTLAEGIEQVGDVLADGLEEALRQTGQSSSSTDPEQPGAAEPETSQKQTSQTESSSDA